MIVAITSTSVDWFLIVPMSTNFSEILIKT